MLSGLVKTAIYVYRERGLNDWNRGIPPLRVLLNLLQRFCAGFSDMRVLMRA